MDKPLHLLTFLGTGNYYETVYLWDEQRVTTRYAPVASTRFLHPTRVTVLVTDEAKEKVYPAFAEALTAHLPAGVRPQSVPIPLGKNEGELWALFTRIVKAIVQPGEPFAFDITHGLRSFPYLALLAAGYVQAAFGIPVRAVLYGAFEVRDTAVTPNVTPMFDLSPMLALLEWAVAADRFNRTGDARYLASLLRRQQKTLALRWQDQPERLRQLSALNNLTGRLQAISQTLRLIRPHEAMEAVAGLPAQVERAAPLLEAALGARPFLFLLDKVVQTYAPLSLAESTTPARQREALTRERAMLVWYAERELWPQAAALGREWLVSWVMAHLGIGPETSSTERQRVEGFLNAEAEAFLQAKKEGRPFVPIFRRGLPQMETVLGLWKSLTDVRNDILHAGMRDQPDTPETLVRSLRRMLNTLQELPLP